MGRLALSFSAKALAWLATLLGPQEKGGLDTRDVPKKFGKAPGDLT